MSLVDTPTESHLNGQPATNGLEMQYLLERLEDLIIHGRRLLNWLVIDEAQAMELIDQIRQAAPREVAEARMLLAQRGRMLQETRAECQAMLKFARDRVASMLQEDGLTIEAKAYIEEMMVEAHKKAEEYQAHARQYILDQLRAQKATLQQHLAEVEAGIEALE
jgi:Mg/Co/Ni transporter MgtE